MKDILAKAEELGKMIAASGRLQALKSVRNDVAEDKDLQADIQALNELGETIAQLEKEVKPVEPDQKRRRRDLQQKVTGHPRMQALARAEADVAELMNRVNNTIYSEALK